MHRWKWQYTVLAAFVLVSGIFLTADWMDRNVPPEDLVVAPWWSGETTEERERQFDGIRLGNLPVYDHLAAANVCDYYRNAETGELEPVVYVKRGSPYTLRYWQTVCRRYSPEIEVPTRIIYTEHSYNEAWHWWRELRGISSWDEFFYDSYLVSGRLAWDPDRGYYAELLIEGEDAEYVWEHLRLAYGDFVVGSAQSHLYFGRMQSVPELTAYSYGDQIIYMEASDYYDE